MILDDKNRSRERSKQRRRKKHREYKSAKRAKLVKLEVKGRCEGKRFRATTDSPTLRELNPHVHTEKLVVEGLQNGLGCVKDGKRIAVQVCAPNTNTVFECSITHVVHFLLQNIFFLKVHRCSQP